MSAKKTGLSEKRTHAVLVTKADRRYLHYFTSSHEALDFMQAREEAGGFEKLEFMSAESADALQFDLVIIDGVGEAISTDDDGQDLEVRGLRFPSPAQPSPMHSKGEVQKIKNVIAAEREGCLRHPDALEMLYTLAKLIDEGIHIDQALKVIEPNLKEQPLASLLYRIRNLSMR